MTKYKIVTDVTNDLTAEERAKLGIIAVSAFASVDNVDIEIDDADDFYEKLVNGTYAAGHLHTGAGNEFMAREAFDQAVAETDEDTVIVYAATSEHISRGAVQSHRLALEHCANDNPERTFLYVPTYCTSNGQALCLQYLAQYTGDDIIGYASDIGKHIVHLFTEREFTYSLMSGRYESAGVRRAAHFLESVKFSPWMYFPSDNNLQFDLRKIMRGDLVIRRWVKYYAQHHIKPEDATCELDRVLRIGYGHKQEIPRAKFFIELLQRDVPDFDPNLVQLRHVGPFVGAHTGPTCLSIFFRQDETR